MFWSWAYWEAAVGANLPYWFSAMTMASVGEAAMQMVAEVQRQYSETPELLDPHTQVGSLLLLDRDRNILPQ